MSKAILVMDMPKSCQSCKLKSRVHGMQSVTHCCNLAEGMITLDKGFKERFQNCPLKDMNELIESIRCRCYEMGLDESQAEIIVSELLQ